MNYNHIIDKINIDIYRKNKTLRSSEMRHKCVLCEEATNIDGSISNQGKRMICNRCAVRKFGSIMEAFDWVRGEMNE